MSIDRMGDASDGWRGGYDGWLSHDRRNDEPDGPARVPAACSVCGGAQRGPTGALVCHTAREQDAAANAARYRR